MNNQKKLSLCFVIGFGLLLGCFFYPFYTNGKIILGSEGSYFLDFILFFRNFSYTWYNAAAGINAASLNFGYVFHLLILQTIFKDYRIVNFFMIYLMYFLPFLAVFLIAKSVKLSSLMAFLIAVLYIVNPFTINFLKSINQWNMFAIYILPSFFLIIYKFYKSKLALFVIFGLNSCLFSFTNANPPTMVIYQIAIFLLVVISELLQTADIKKKLPEDINYSFKSKQVISRSWMKFYTLKLIIKFKPVVGTYLVVLTSFVLFNFWWISNWFSFLEDAQKIYSKGLAISWLRGTMQFIPVFWRNINLISLMQYPVKPDYDYFAAYFSSSLSIYVLIIPIVIFICFLFVSKIKSLPILIIATLMILSAFLSKGVYGVFGGVYEFMVMNIPFFSIFKSAAEKWGVLYVFLFTLFLIFSFQQVVKQKVYKLLEAILLIYVVYCSIPFINSNFLPEAKINAEVTHSKKFIDKKDYQDLRLNLNQDLSQYRVLSMPGSNNYQVALHLTDNFYYTGNDPVLSNTNKPYITPYNGTFTQTFPQLYDQISNSGYMNLFGIYNIRKIIFNKDLYPWFGYAQKENVPEIESIFDKKLKSQKGLVIDIYDTGEFFLPRFYIPENIIYSPSSNQKDLINLLTIDRFSPRTAIFFNPDNEVGNRFKYQNEIVKNNSSVNIITAEIQSTIDEKKLREGINGMNHSWVNFPYARWKPGSFVYPYIVRKEEKAKSQYSELPDQLFETNLFYAAKRIMEIQRWNLTLSDEQFEQVMNRYKEEMISCISNLKKIRTSGRDTFDLLSKLEVSFSVHKKRTVDILKGDYQDVDNIRFGIVNNIFDDLDNQLTEIFKLHTQTKYHLQVPEDDEYEIVSENKKTPIYFQLENIPVRSQDDFALNPQNSDQNEDWVSYGKKMFVKGDYYLHIVDSQQPNLFLITNGGFLDQEQALKLPVSDQGQSPIESKSLPGWDSNKCYRISFSYQTKKGQINISITEKNQSGYIFDEPDANKDYSVINSDLMTDENSGMKEYEAVFYPHYKKNAYLTIKGQGVGNDQIDIEINDLKMTEVFEPKLFLKKVNLVSNPRPPQMSFLKINPTKYIVNIQGAKKPFFLIFSEAFHKGWKTYNSKDSELEISHAGIIGNYFNGEIKELTNNSGWFDNRFFETWTKRPLEESSHTVVNGYANSWYIDPKKYSQQGENIQFIVEYKPQQMFYIGSFISITVFVSSSLLLIYSLVKKRINK